ncbi:hypothetical protein VSH64_00370 [Amycolatopsis rhabdoformis]|uniref:Inositol phosphorylceramide synthase n=1 Tax=Amycolatopsis rhabdoformis TaxID=1448059 RepID=A0ABZ1I861_9PSEU|nr:hypothetical protein [Amycolatopsis rhabdoformis]WSE30600.1 hypothetical protein VSH64_00370 [Amycolatopsis rhabdoformis]
MEFGGKTGETTGGRLHRPLLVLAGAMAVLLVVSALGLLFDHRTLVNAPLWAKPFKFTVSIGLYALTLAWLLGLLTRFRRTGWWLGTVFAVGISTDLALLVWQILIRDRPLHFNVETPGDVLIDNVLATGAFTAWAATAAVVVLLLFQKLPDRALASALRWGTGFAVVGMGLALMMFSPTPPQEALLDAGVHPPMVGGHTVGLPDGGPGLPLLGWSTVGGDLRIPHFVGIHAIQALPLLALALAALARRYPVLSSDLVRRRLVWTGAVGYAGLLALVTWQALRGQSIVRPDFWTLSAAAGLIAIVAAGAALSLRSPRVHALTEF